MAGECQITLSSFPAFCITFNIQSSLYIYNSSVEYHTQPRLLSGTLNIKAEADNLWSWAIL